MNVLDLLGTLKIDTTQYTSGLNKAKDENSKFISAFKNVEKASDGLNNKLKTTGNNFKTVSDKVKKLTDEFSKTSKSTETLQNKIKVVGSQYKAATDKVKSLTTALNKSVKETGAQSEQSQRLARQLSNAEKEADALGKELRELASEYDKAGKEAEEFSKKSKFSGALNGLKSLGSGVGGVATAIGGIGAKFLSAGKVIGQFVAKGIADLAKLAAKAAAVGSAVITAVATVTAKVVKDSVKSYANYEQLVGGMETLFKGASDTVIKNAKNAYLTAGVSANTYMETVTTFSASLIKSLGGDVDKAAKYADRAMIDMSDNANKMGNDMESIMNVYKGLAKEQYMLLDNLGLSYSGTKEGAQQLVKDASKLKDEMKALGVTVDDTSLDFGNMVNAISVMQMHMGISGTTVKEAGTTITGSINAMKAAWENFKVALIDKDYDMHEVLDNLMTTIFGDGSDTFLGVLGNVVPAVESALTGLSDVVSNRMGDVIEKILPIANSIIPKFITLGGQIMTSLLQGFRDNIETIAPVALEIASTIGTTLLEAIPLMLEIGIQIVEALLNGIIENFDAISTALQQFAFNIGFALEQAIPQFLDMGLTILTKILEGLLSDPESLISSVTNLLGLIGDTINTHLPVIVELGITLLLTLIKGIGDSLPQLIPVIMEAISIILDTVIRHLPDIINLGVLLLAQFALGILNGLPHLENAIFGILDDALGWFESYFSEWARIGRYLIDGLWQGISAAWGGLKSKVQNLGKSLTAGLKGVFGIHSPSTVFRDEIGKNLALGLEQGWDKQYNEVKRNIEGDLMIDNIGEIEPLTAKVNTEVEQGNFIINGIKQALDNAFSNFSELLESTQGDLYVPVYIGDELLDTVIVNSNRRTLYRSGGRV